MSFLFKLTPIVFLLGSYYLSARIISGLSLSGKTANIIRAVIFLLAVITVAERFLRYSASPEFIAPISFIGSYWMGIFAIAVIAMILNDIVMLFNSAFKIPRFKFYSTITALAITAALSIAGIINGLPAFTAVKKVYFPNPNLPAEKFTITLIADTHITNTTSPRVMQNLVNKVNSLNSDIIVIAGDFIDADITGAYEKLSVNKFSAPYGVFAVSGNHEYSQNRFNSFLRVCEMAGITVLQNESAVIGDMINLAGVNDKRAIRFKLEGPDVNKALANIKADLPVILLSHQPEIFDEAAGKIFLQLSGHTHAGQTIPGNIIRKLFYEYFYGAYAKNNSHLYVTSGTRHWGPPLRLFSRNKIVQVVIENKG